MLRIEQFNIAGLARNQVAHVVQHTRAGPIAKAGFAAPWTRQMLEVPTTAYDLRLREIFGVGNSRSGIGDILSWTRHGNTLLGLASLAWALPYLRSRIIPYLHAMVLKTRIFHDFAGSAVMGASREGVPRVDV
jgi:hypothetical protein